MVHFFALLADVSQEIGDDTKNQTVSIINFISYYVICILHSYKYLIPVLTTRRHTAPATAAFPETKAKPLPMYIQS